MSRTGCSGFVLGALVAFVSFDRESSVVLAQSENVLIIVADDLGVDMLECYAEGTDLPPTPTIDMLRDAGVLFRNAWSYPICSPSRATIQTGRYGFRTGVGATVFPTDDVGLPYSETIIPEMLDLNPSLGYAHAAIGKWHLTSDSQNGDNAPNLSGYAHFSGTMGNIEDYFDWPKTVNGETADTDVYATTDNVNEAIAWINDQGENPWFMWLAFNAPHDPFHAPPDELHTFDLPNDPPNALAYRAAIQAMDTEIGRLLASIPVEIVERTNIIFVGDNGTPGLVTLPPFEPNHAKHTLYEGGVNVPLIISGPQVVSAGDESTFLVHITDIFITALDMMGVDTIASIPPGTVIDARSMLPILLGETYDARLVAYTEFFKLTSKSENHGQAVRNSTYKLIRFNLLPEEFYNLTLDPFESMDLLLGELGSAEQDNYDELTLALDETTPSACPGDANSDGMVNPLDSGYVLARYGCSVGTGDSPCDVADQNGDGEVNPLDGGFVLARYGPCP